MNLNSRTELIARLFRGGKARQQFIDSHLSKGLAYQIRATRDERQWSQEDLAAKVGMNQNAISRLESPDYGKPTLTTLKRLAAAFDVALIVRFVPFSELVDWVSGTPRVNAGLSTEALAVPEFDADPGFQTALQEVPADAMKASPGMPAPPKPLAVAVADSLQSLGYDPSSAQVNVLPKKQPAARAERIEAFGPMLVGHNPLGDRTNQLGVRQ